MDLLQSEKIKILLTRKAANLPQGKVLPDSGTSTKQLILLFNLCHANDTMRCNRKP